MNIFLIPHNGTRHVVVAFFTGFAPLLVWWLLLNWLVVLGPALFENGLLWAPQAETAIVFGSMAGAIAWANVAAEGGLRRRALVWKLVLPLVAALLSSVLTVLLVVGISFVTPLLIGLNKNWAGFAEVIGDPHTTTLTFTVADWLVAGFIVGLCTLIVRAAWGSMGALAQFIPDSIKAFVEIPANPPKVSVWTAIDHLLAGPAAALAGAGVWHMFAHIFFKDLYLASAVGFMTWGFMFGLLAWGVPSDLYAGWVRVLSAHRFGHRIPIDAPEGGPVERVLGHYPRGLDLWVGAEHGVAELHASFVVDGKGEYAVRGLSQQPMGVKRALESIDLAYDPGSPVPLETDLRMEDVITIGPKGQQTVVEFILLPKEER
jgi:hypothetical protein